MSGPVDPLQRALWDVLTGDAALAAMIGERVYDQAPENAAFPYVTLGEAQTLPREGDGYEGADMVLTLHVWSRAVGFPQAKAIGSAVRAAFRPGLGVPGLRVVDFIFDGARYLRDPDGVTSHGILTFTALVEPS